MQRSSDSRLESIFSSDDIQKLQQAFVTENSDYENILTVTKEEFCELIARVLNKGSRDECFDLFDRIDAAKEGWVDWEKFASHMLLEFYEKDDRVKSSQVPQWKNLKVLTSPHKDIVQKIQYNNSKYISLSKESNVAVWDQQLQLIWTSKTSTDSCKSRDLWATSFAILHSINKIAISYTSKEIIIYDMSKAEFAPQYKIFELQHTALSLTFWANPENTNEAILAWSDTGGCVHALIFQSANIALFERPAAPAGEKKQETLLSIHLRNIVDGKYRNARYVHHSQHVDWARQVMYSPTLECFISCSTSSNASLVIGWLEKLNVSQNNMRTSMYRISQGVNAFDYHEQLNLIVTAGVNNNVCLWNPYVVSKPNGLLRGHMASVIQVQFNRPRGQLISFSKDKVLRIWDIQLQVCIQRLAGIFPKGPEATSILYFDEHYNRLFISFNYQLTYLEMKAEVKDHVRSHDSPVVATLYSRAYNQIVSICQMGTMIMWMADTGQKVKQFTNTHSNAEVTCMVVDETETRLLTGSTDGLIKMWDFNGHCYHAMHCSPEDHPCDVGCILSLKTSVLAAGWAKYITIFRLSTFHDYNVQISDWRGGQVHSEDILCLAASSGIIASGSYCGEIVIWNQNSEQSSRQLNQRAKKFNNKKSKNQDVISRETTMQSAGLQRAKSGLNRLRPQSRELSILSLPDMEEESTGGEGSSSVTRLLFLDTHRQTVNHSGGANLVSCGGNGWVRFWNTTECTLLGEFIAHEQAGSIIMAIDENNQWLATGDVDGLVKTWDISQYCTAAVTQTVTALPPLKAQFQAHLDMITAMDIFERNRCHVLLTSSCDGSVSIWDMAGRSFGTFGQEGHWKIEPYVVVDEIAGAEEQSERVVMEQVVLDNWQPDEQAVSDPKSFRVNTWQESILGKNYQEIRTLKRERKQPSHSIEQPIAGPFAALLISDLSQIDSPQKPDSLRSLDKMMDEKQTTEVSEASQPSFADTLNAVFDEKNFFPKYILDHEAKMKAHHAKILQNEQKKAGDTLKSLLPINVETDKLSSKAHVSKGSTGRHSNIKIY